ncbi:hypothetical protein LshimejAT787_1001060 [Lyophyllum shimeji]|uniref:Uncharacterized protein n=1 Tax=Lyophyllum shimeji TaxID=47721 RepID=A0A9P3PUJ2_LYOSH|nr:hypothetical protein LshimejAT787_1001060 [Lyophyllum shimeji]
MRCWKLSTWISTLIVSAVAANLSFAPPSTWRQKPNVTSSLADRVSASNNAIQRVISSFINGNFASEEFYGLVADSDFDAQTNQTAYKTVVNDFYSSITLNPEEAFVHNYGAVRIRNGVQYNAVLDLARVTVSGSDIYSGAWSGPPSTEFSADNCRPSLAGPIAGGVLGGVALVLAIILAFVFLRRRRRVRHKHEEEVDDNLVLPKPYIMTRTGASGIPASTPAAPVSAGFDRKRPSPALTQTSRASASTAPSSSVGAPSAVGSTSPLEGTTRSWNLELGKGAQLTCFRASSM